MPWGWQGDAASGRPVVGFDSLTRLWRASHQMQPHTPPFIYPPSPSNFLSSLHSKWTNSVFPSTPWGTMALTSTHPERDRERERERQEKKREDNRQNLSNGGLRTQNLEKSSVRMKGQTEPKVGRNGEYGRLGSDNRKQQTWIKSRYRMLKGGHHFKRNHVRRLKWCIKCTSCNWQLFSLSINESIFFLINWLVVWSIKC